MGRFAIAPMNSNRQVSVSASACQPKKSMSCLTAPALPQNRLEISRSDQHEDCKNTERKPKSPTRLTMKALIAAAFADGF